MPKGRPAALAEVDEKKPGSTRPATLAGFVTGRGAEAPKANQALVDELAKIAELKQATPAQIALAWLLKQKPWIVPIPETTKLHRLEENLGATSVELTADDLAAIEAALSRVIVQGERYPARMQALINR